MQLYQRIFDYIHEYQHLVYDYYSKHVVPFLVTYYNLNITDTIWDNDTIFGGSYEVMGDLTGMRWNKYLLLPVYYIEDISSAFDGQEIGLVKENETNIVIPSSYGITPQAHDIVKFEQAYLRPSNDIYPLFTVTGVEIHPNTDRRFWKLKLMVEEPYTNFDIESQTIDSYVFFDYDKSIHTLDDASSLTRMMSKNASIKSNMKSLWDSNSGFYFIT